MIYRNQATLLARDIYCSELRVWFDINYTTFIVTLITYMYIELTLSYKTSVNTKYYHFNTVHFMSKSRFSFSIPIRIWIARFNWFSFLVRCIVLFINLKKNLANKPYARTT